jgi:hypothetical protein
MEDFTVALVDYDKAKHELLDTDAPEHFNPEYVIYRELGPTFPWYYSRIDKPLVIKNIPGWTNIADYVKSVALGMNQPPPPPPIPPQETVAEDSELTIPIRKHSYIILAINKGLGATFAYDASNRDVQAIDFGEYYDTEQLAKDSYGELRHIDPQTGLGYARAIPNCRMVYFSAIPTPVADTSQKLNFNLLAKRTGTIVDPDIRYPGNGGNP